MFMDLTILGVQERAAMYFDKQGFPSSGDAYRESAEKRLTKHNKIPACPQSVKSYWDGSRW